VNNGTVLGGWVEVHKLLIVVLCWEAGNVAMEVAGIVTLRCDNMCSKVNIPDSVNSH